MHSRVNRAIRTGKKQVVASLPFVLKQSMLPFEN